MLGNEPQLIEEYVKTGQVQLVFWPVLNHGNPSTFSTLTAECIGQQSPDAFWVAHHLLFENQGQLWSADRDYYVKLAVEVGVDQATFEACYDGPAGLETILELDALRRQRGIYSQPFFDINGELLGGYQQFDTFAAAFAQLSENN